MLSIQEYVKEVPSKRKAFILEDKFFTYSDLSKIYINNKEKVASLRNACVVVNSRKNSELAMLLYLLDGYVKRILFLPNDIKKELKDKHYIEANIDSEVYLENDVLQIINIKKKQVNHIPLQTEWVIPTSGTTSDPKLIIHTLSSLTRTTKNNIELGSKYIWGLTFDLYRFSGIQVFLQSLLSGSSIIIPKSDDNIFSIVKLFLKEKCNVVSATPSFWRKLFMVKESKNLNLIRATLGGEIADQNILNTIKKTYKDIRITHIYASTELGVGFAVTDGKVGFPTSYLKDGYNELRFKIDENSFLLIAINMHKQKAFSYSIPYDEEGYLNTGDLVKVDKNRVVFLGRDSCSINVGGNKVQVEEIESILLSSGLISCVFVYAKKSSIIGSLICADIVPKNVAIDKSKLKSDILEFCKNNLESFKIPAIIKFVSELELTDSGKMKRK